jgi:hypothetical protein
VFGADIAEYTFGFVPFSMAIPSAFRQQQLTSAVPLLTDPPAIAHGYDAAHQETMVCDGIWKRRRPGKCPFSLLVIITQL